MKQLQLAITLVLVTCSLGQPMMEVCMNIQDSQSCLANLGTCKWDLVWSICRPLLCQDIADLIMCQSVGNYQCRVINDKCRALSCSSITSQTECSKYQIELFNNLENCIWASRSNTCVRFDRTFQCRSYLNQQSCETQSDGFDCVWDQMNSLCNQITCSTLDQANCQNYQDYNTQLNYQHCLWTSGKQPCSAYSLVNCEDIDNQQLCMDMQSAAQLQCGWINQKCNTVTCKDMDADTCLKYVSPSNRLNGMHCYPASGGCTEAPQSPDCSLFTTQESCTIWPSIARQRCAWVLETCRVASCETLPYDICSQFQDPTLVNGVQCLISNDKCMTATCELLNLQLPSECNMYKSKGDSLNGSTCVFLQGKCHTQTPALQLSCSEAGAEDICYFLIDSNGVACTWTDNQQCVPLQCQLLQGQFSYFCKEFQYPKRSTNGYQCIPNGQFCTEVVFQDYGCWSFNNNQDACNYYNQNLGQAALNTCIYSEFTNFCYSAQRLPIAGHTVYQCADFSQSESDCQQSLSLPYLKASLLCQYFNSDCVAVQASACSGILTEKACTGAMIIGSAPCFWDKSKCVVSTCKSLDYTQCNADQNCVWMDGKPGVPYCDMYTILMNPSRGICKRLRGIPDALSDRCMPPLCSNFNTQESCSYAIGLKNTPLNCYWKQSNIQALSGRIQFSNEQCVPRTSTYPCQTDLNAGLECSTIAQNIEQCFSLDQSFGWNGECILCVPLTNVQCSKTASACSWLGSKCTGQRLNDGPSYQSYQSCILADSTLGFQPNAPGANCKQCLPINNEYDCSYLIGCRWVKNTAYKPNGGYCTGLRASDAFYSTPNGRQRCESIPLLAYSDTTQTCINCAMLASMQQCQQEPLCLWSAQNNQCVGQRLFVPNQQYTYTTCSAFGKPYGYDSQAKVCLTCFSITAGSECQIQGSACRWNSDLQLCVGQRLTDESISYVQCQSFGENYGYSAQQLPHCVPCGRLTEENCARLPYICYFSQGVCNGRRATDAFSFVDCWNYYPYYGFDAAQGRCLLCSGLATCSDASYCIESTQGCIGRALSTYTNTSCTDLGQQYAVDGEGVCYDCSVSECASSELCRYQMALPDGSMQCLRNRGCYSTCMQIQSQLDCRDIISFGQRVTCNWFDGRCQPTSCEQLPAQSCSQTYAANSLVPNCQWSEGACVPSICYLLTTQADCNKHFKSSLNNEYCTWSESQQHCYKYQGEACSEYLNQQDCLSVLNKCYWDQTHLLCHQVGCFQLTTAQQCNTYLTKQLNSIQYCYWYAAEIGGQCLSLPSVYSCSQFNNADTCSASASCIWTQEQCTADTCGLHLSESDCMQYGQYPIQPGQYCIWSPPCTAVPQIRCDLFTTAESCNLDPNASGQLCQWNASGCRVAQCSLLSQAQCLSFTTKSLNGGGKCLWTGKGCTNLNDATCQSLTDIDTCLTQTGLRDQCLWNSSICQVGDCSMLTSESACMNYLTVMLNNHYCFWNPRSNVCQNTSTITCGTHHLKHQDTLLTEQSCQAYTSNALPVCRYEYGRCSSLTCFDLTQQQCTQYRFGMADGSFCDTINGWCATIGVQSCSAISSKETCLATVFTDGRICDWNITSCIAQSCSNYKSSCSCQQPRPNIACVFDYQHDLCSSITCQSVGTTEAQCTTVGCKYDPVHSACIEPTLFMPSEAEYSNRVGPSDYVDLPGTSPTQQINSSPSYPSFGIAVHLQINLIILLSIFVP